MNTTKGFVDRLFCTIHTVTGISRRQIEGTKRKAEITEARSMAIYILHRNGFHKHQIGKICRVTYSWVALVCNTFEDNIKQIEELSINYKKITDLLNAANIQGNRKRNSESTRRGK